MHLKELYHWPHLDKEQTITGCMDLAGRQMGAVLSAGGEKSVAVERSRILEKVQTQVSRGWGSLWWGYVWVEVTLGERGPGEGHTWERIQHTQVKTNLGKHTPWEKGPPNERAGRE